MSAAPTDTASKGEPESSTCTLDLTEPFLLGDWRIDPASRTASQGETVVKIDPRNLRVLQILTERYGQVVSQRELEALAWEGVVVTPDSLYQSIRQLRQALQDTKSPARYIETVPRRGYRMVAEPRTESSATNVSNSSVALFNDRGASRTQFGRAIGRVVKSRLTLVLSLVFLISIVALKWHLASSRGDGGMSSATSQQRSNVTSGGPREPSVTGQGIHNASYKTLRALGLDALSRGNPHEAIEYFEQAFRRQVSDAGERNEFAIEALTDIANAYMWLDDEVAAHDAAAKAVAIANQIGPNLTTQRIWSVSILAETLIVLGDYSQAETLIVKLVEASRKELGLQDPTLFNPLYSLALLRYAQGQLPEAERLMLEAGSIAVQLLGAHSDHMATAKSVLAQVLLDRHEFSRAEQEARIVINITNRHRSNQPHPHAVTAIHTLAEALMGQGKYARAEIHLREELEALEETRAVDWRVARAASALGEVYMRTHRLAEAERYLSLAKRKLTRTKGWPIEREVRNLARRLEEFHALRPKQVSALTK